MAIQIMDFRKGVDPDSAVLAEVDLYLSGLNIHLRKCRIIRSKNGNLFVGMPSYKDVNEVWVNYFQFEEGRQKRLACEILEVCKDRLEAPEPAKDEKPVDEDVPF